MTAAATPDVLAAIVATARRRVETARARLPIDRLVAACPVGPAGQPAFHSALSAPGRLAVIAECKRRSPSRGVLRACYDAAEIAGAYEDNGAAAVSVLTEPAFFDGAVDHLREVRARVALPVLCKDFIVDAYQLAEARAAGADAALLIVAALDPATLGRLLEFARGLGLAALVETHTEPEVGIAVDAGATCVGVNARDLRTLEVDLRRTDRLAAAVPDHVTAVAESGLRSHEDLCRLRDAGYDAFLVGERLVTAARPGDALRDLLGRARPDRGRQW